MSDDPIVEEVHRTRREIMDAQGHDLHAYVEYLREQAEAERRRGRVVISTPFRPRQPRTAAENDAA